MKKLEINEKNVEKLILTRIKLGLAGLGMISALSTNAIDVKAAETDTTVVEQDIEAGAIGTPVEDIDVNTQEGFYDEEDFEKDLEKDPTLGQTIDPNVVQTEAERKGIVTPTPTPDVTPTPTPTPDVTPEVTPEAAPVVVEEVKETPIVKMGQDGSSELKFILGMASIITLSGALLLELEDKRKKEKNEVTEESRKLK